MKAELVWYTMNSNMHDYVYLICPNCSYMTETGTLCIKVPRPQYGGYIKTNCPKCNADIGIIAKGLNDDNCYFNFIMEKFD